MEGASLASAMLTRMLARSCFRAATSWARQAA